MDCIINAFKYLAKCLLMLMMLCFALLCFYYFVFKNISLASNSYINGILNNVTIPNLKLSPFGVGKKNGTILLWTKVYFCIF